LDKWSNYRDPIVKIHTTGKALNDGLWQDADEVLQIKEARTIKSGTLIRSICAGTLIIAGCFCG
jgi:hypothetical protein